MVCGRDASKQRWRMGRRGLLAKQAASISLFQSSVHKTSTTRRRRNGNIGRKHVCGEMTSVGSNVGVKLAAAIRLSETPVFTTPI